MGMQVMDAQALNAQALNAQERRLLNDYQHDFSLSTTPFADIAAQLGTDESSVLQMISQLQTQGVISRVGPVFQTDRIGASSLVAAAVAEECLQEVAALVNSYPEVNHNYAREHYYNLWFVVTASNKNRLQQVVQDIEQRTGLVLLILPMLEAYCIDLGFDLQWTT